MAVNLTELGVSRYKKRDSRYEIQDVKVKALRLVVQPSGAKSWAARFWRHNRQHKLTLGPFPEVTLEAARRGAKLAVAAVADGRNPVEERKEARRREERERAEAITTQTAYERYETEHIDAALGKDTATNVKRLFRLYILPAIGKTQVKDVTHDDCKAIWTKEARRGNPSNANKIFVALRHFFRWLRRNSILANPSPLDDVEAPEGSAPRDRVLKTEELRLVWNAAGKMEYPFGPFVRLLILTLSRRNEVSEMVRGELDVPASQWTLPSERTKNGRVHLVPLAPAALDLIKALPEHDSKAGWLFTTDGETAASNFSKRKRTLDAIVTELNDGKPIPNWTLHDLRRTGDTGMHNLGVQPHIVEACVNHVSGHKGGVAGRYNWAEYLPEKRAAFELWAAHVMKIADAV
jgi:integrase